ncbi:hypothetical protein [Arsenicicoccus sp. oral taxon 190]|uniref:hypothetical protein n=1 Tax=Arsenicicoccus sp. oral taxon 190 TaxID=1658671 RepID=UPI00067A3A60|nr:hypothetical protein [Arsenicicoccus sp. oral taxon 190]AKT50839.1 membrane protein [Arsenicicoccus sp. oral taxon 190]
MYSLLWRALPGPAWLRALLCLLLAAVVVWVCFTWVFPWLADLMPFNDQTVEPTA